MPGQWQLSAILMVWGVIQAAVMYALDRNLREAAAWIVLVLVVFNCLWGIIMAWQFRWRVRLWLYDNVPAIRARVSDAVSPALNRGTGRAIGAALVTGLAAGTTVGPIFAMALEQLLWPGANAFRSAVIGMVLGMPVLFVVGFVWMIVYARIHR